MTIIEKLYQGEVLLEKELKAIALGWGYTEEETGDYEFVDEIKGELNRWTQDRKTIFRVGNDYWCLPWRRALTEYQENEFYNQPYRVVPKTEQIVVTRYERMN